MIDFSTGITAVAVILVAILALVAATRHLRRRQRSDDDDETDLAVDLSEFTSMGPPREGPQLEFYNVPVRLVVLVVAPVGRDGTLPHSERIAELVGQLTPGLSEVLLSQQPTLYCWPPQLSSHGFVRSFFNNVPLPGDGGKATPWCSVAGKLEGEQLLIGMVCCGGQANSLGEVTLSRSTGWLDVLRVRKR